MMVQRGCLGESCVLPDSGHGAWFVEGNSAMGMTESRGGVGSCSGRQSSVSRWHLRQRSSESCCKVHWWTGTVGRCRHSRGILVHFFSSTGFRAELALLFPLSTQGHQGLSGATQPAMASSPLMHSPMGMDMSRAALAHMLFPRSTPCLQRVRPPGLPLFWGFLLGCHGKGQHFDWGSPRDHGLPGLCCSVG